MIQHKIWQGSRYAEGAHGGKRVAIMGYSHWDDSGDHERKTLDTVEGLINGEPGAAFFSTIRNYFGYDSHEEFWPTVTFFNYVPNFVGDGTARFATATSAQYEAARSRFLRVIDENKPDVLIAFSTKVHEELPEGIIWAQDRLNSGDEYGRYARNGHTTLVAFLRHPQGAPGEQMRMAIADLLEK